MAERRFVVVNDIPHGGVLAHTRGQIITDEEAIERNGWQDYVAPAGSKAAAEVQAAITGRPVADFQTATSTGRAAAKTQEG